MFFHKEKQEMTNTMCNVNETVDELKGILTKVNRDYEDAKRSAKAIRNILIWTLILGPIGAGIGAIKERNKGNL